MGFNSGFKGLMCSFYMPKFLVKTGKCSLADMRTSSAICSIANDIFEHNTALYALIFYQLKIG